MRKLCRSSSDMPVKVSKSVLINSTSEKYHVNGDSALEGNCSNGYVQENDDFISAEYFVERIHKVGETIACDGSSKVFASSMNLPVYYNKELYRKGQDFFYKHIFSLFLGKFLGLIALFSVPTVNILIMTNKSSTPLTAYKRYLQTIFHMCIWYDKDFEPESSLWKSIEKVRNMHDSASKKASSFLKTRITQRDMALTQFGFMGIALVRSEMLGVYNVSNDEWKGFIHLWRVIGHVLGIEDRFNICRESVEETKQICQVIIEKELIPLLKNTDESFDKMSKVLIEGLSTMNPVLQQEAFIYYLYMVMENSGDTTKSRGNLQPLSMKSMILLKIIIWFMWASQFTIVRLYLKYLQIGAIWLMKNFPFLAFYKFGQKNSYVTI